jgi:hypothetical protein
MTDNDIEAPEVVIPVDTHIPKKLIKRNEYGLICDNSITYTYDDNGFIDWRKIIPSKYLVPNRQMFEKNGKQVPLSINGLDDRELLILLGGIKELAQIRGFTDVTYKVECPSNDYVIAICRITWIPNYETEGNEVTFSAIGDANLSNTSKFGKLYLGPIAENRAFVRAVRNFLKINIVGQDEVPLPIEGGASNPNTKSSTAALKEVMNMNNISFDIIKQKLIEEKFLDDNGQTAETYQCENDIPTDKQFELISRIKKRAQKKDKQTGEQNV